MKKLFLALTICVGLNTSAHAYWIVTFDTWISYGYAAGEWISDGICSARDPSSPFYFDDAFWGDSTGVLTTWLCGSGGGGGGGGMGGT